MYSDFFIYAEVTFDEYKLRSQRKGVHSYTEHKTWTPIPNWCSYQWTFLSAQPTPKDPRLTGTVLAEDV